MITQLKKRIIILVEMTTLMVLFLILLGHNIYVTVNNINDSVDVIKYCAECVDTYSDEIDNYLKIPETELLDAVENNSLGHTKVTYLIYAIISSDLTVIKTDLSGNTLQFCGDEDLFSDHKSEINKVMKSGSKDTEPGRIKSVLYTTVIKKDFKYILLLNTEGWRTEIIQTILISILGLILAAVPMYFVGLFLSKIIAKPVEEALEKQNRFIADASHELKTPISVINSNIAVLEKEYGNNKWMSYIKEEGMEMNSLINQLLNLCRLDYSADAKSDAARKGESFDISEAILEAALPFDSAAFEKNVMLDSDKIDPFYVYGQKDDFKKMITILVDNAISHANAGGSVTINTKQGFHRFMNTKSSIAYVEVSNTGSTISAEDMPYIFDRFYKSRDEKSSGNNNFGLGLSIVKSIAEKNNYEVTAASKDNVTTFRIKLPLARKPSN